MSLIQSGEKVFLPHRSYAIEVKIKGQYLRDNQLRTIRISSTLAGYGPNIELGIFITAKDMFLEEIYGQDPITLTIRLLGQDASELERYDIDLMCTRISHGAPMAVALSDSSQEDRVSVTISTVVRDVFSSMTTMVNGVWGGADAPKTVKEVAEDIVGEAGAGLEYDTEGENTEAIDQICVPPLVLYDALLYLDRTFGSHDGVPAVFCRLDNTVHVINLSKRIKKNAAVKISQPSLDKKDLSELEKKSSDGKHFYLQGEFKNDFVGNSKFAANATTIIHVAKPADTLFHLVEQDISGVCSDYGLIHKNSNPFVDSKIDRTKVLEQHIGYEYTESFANSMIAKRIFDISTIQCVVGGNIMIENLLKIGDPLEMDLLVTEYLNVGGKYIMYKTDILYMKEHEGDWTCTVDIVGVRTNKSI